MCSSLPLILASTSSEKYVVKMSILYKCSRNFNLKDVFWKTQEFKDLVQTGKACEFDELKQYKWVGHPLL